MFGLICGYISVTTTVDSSQYVWFILLERTSGSFTNHVNALSLLITSHC